MSFGKKETWKVVYYPVVLNNGYRGVALVEAESKSDAIFYFTQQYRGQFSTIETVEKFFK